MKQHTAANVLTAILAVLLSILLVTVSLAAVVQRAGAGILNTDNLVILFKDAAKDVFLDEEIIVSAGETKNIDEEFAKDLIESQAANELLTLLADEISAGIFGTSPSETLTAEKLKEITQRNMPEILDLVEKHTDLEMDRDEVAQNILSAIDDNEEELSETLSAAATAVDEIDEDTLQIIRTVLGKTASRMLIAACVVLALLIYVCRFRRFGGFVWLGADAMITGLFTVGLILLTGFAADYVKADAGMSAQEADVILSLIAVVKSTVTTAAIVLFAVSVVLIAAGVVLKMISAKKKA